MRASIYPSGGVTTLRPCGRRPRLRHLTGMRASGVNNPEFPPLRRPGSDKSNEQGGGSMSTEAPAPGAIHTSEDEKILHKLGYAQELFRAMGGFQNFAISFTIISILAGCLTSYYIAFESGGPVAVTWGWLLVGLFSTIVALAMAEIASSYPDRGRPLLLGVEARQPRLGLGDRLVQPDRADRGHGGDRLRPRDVRDGAVRHLFSFETAHERLVRLQLQRDVYRALRGPAARRMPDQRLRRPDHGDAQHVLGLLAHDRRRVHRDRADRRPDHHQSASLRVHARRSTRPATAAT